MTRNFHLTSRTKITTDDKYLYVHTGKTILRVFFFFFISFENFQLIILLKAGTGASGSAAGFVDQFLELSHEDWHRNEHFWFVRVGPYLFCGCDYDFTIRRCFDFSLIEENFKIPPPTSSQDVPRVYFYFYFYFYLLIYLFIFFFRNPFTK